MNKTKPTLATRIKALETEYTHLVKSETSTLKEMQRIDEIEQLIPYVQAIKWEIVRERLTRPEQK
jgi:hypothetical protein